MKRDKKAAAGILSLILWAALLTVLLHLLDHRGGWHLIEGLVWLAKWIVLAVALLFCWWLFVGLRVNRFTKRLSEAGFTYLRTHGVDAYLREMDACCEMPGAKNAVMSGIPARDYVTILKIQTLREAGRREEALALLRTAQQKMKGERAQLLLRAEKEKLGVDDEEELG